MLDWAPPNLVFLGSAVVLIVSVVAAVHAVLYKEEVRAAIAWVGLIILVPLVGSILYYLIGVNRIRRRAVALRRETERRNRPHAPEGLSPEILTRLLAGGGPGEPAELAKLVKSITRRALLFGNRILPLSNGDEAYPAMLEAIDHAQRSIVFLTYIFDSDRWGRRFVEALTRARSRGVEVRILVDAVGARYSRAPVVPLLRKNGVKAAVFLPTFSTLLPSFNLRNHRKVMVVDGRLGFTGGMNIREGFVLGEGPKHPGIDLHFRVEGPVVRHLAEVFAEDWEFTTRESLWGDDWFPPLEAVGGVVARGIADGPDEDLDVLNFTLLGAIARARQSIRIVTPYFLPDQALVYALNTAALSGIEVDVVVPESGNLRLVTWAMWGQIALVLRHGCRVWLSPESPFDHSKLMVVDDYWVLCGSSNWDPRSLRLNFEFNVECYDRDLARGMRELVDSRISLARRLTFEELGSRSMALRLRDGAARLLTPYL
jgi:cardiolipin synthase A/B